MIAAPSVFAQSVVTATQEAVIPAGYLQWVTATCPAGYVVTGGGFSQTDLNQNSSGGDTEAMAPAPVAGYIYFTIQYVWVLNSQPTPDNTGWEIQGITSAINGGALHVYAQCLQKTS